MMMFAGSCTKCGGDFSWDDLTQQLPCLEAKNSGLFGECDNGVQIDEHTFDQECDTCADEDEGFGDVEENNRDDDARGKKRQRTT
jgi:hypothetical protein